MKESYLFDMSFNNVVFKNRNQLYGAYQIRRSYNNTVKQAALLAIAIFTAALAWPLFHGKEVLVSSSLPVIPEKEERIIDLTKVAIKQEEAIKPKAENKAIPSQTKENTELPAVKENVKTMAYKAPKVVDDQTTTTEELPDNIDLAGANIGLENIDGEATASPSTTMAENERKSGNGTESGLGTGTEFVHVEQMPSFEGGDKELQKFLSRNLRYPHQAQRAEVEGLVIVSFVVASNGEIQDLKVLKGLGFGTEEEALRVMQKMPKWKPGIQNQRAVPVRLTLPIRFNLN